MDVDVAIVGGGPAGLALANAAVGLGLRVKVGVLASSTSLSRCIFPWFAGKSIWYIVIEISSSQYANKISMLTLNLHAGVREHINRCSSGFRSADEPKWSGCRGINQSESSSKVRIIILRGTNPKRSIVIAASGRTSSRTRRIPNGPLQPKPWLMVNDPFVGKFPITFPSVAYTSGTWKSYHAWVARSLKRGGVQLQGLLGMPDLVYIVL
jgi:hypothetical protein